MAQEAIELETSVGYALKVTASALRTAMDAALRPVGLSVPQYSCLEVLEQRPGLSVAELARATFVTRQSAHTLVQGLEHRGLLERPSAPVSGRALPTRLTPAGREVLARASHLVAGVEGRMLAGIPEEGRARLLSDLATCAAALDPAVVDPAGGDRAGPGDG